MPPYCWYSEKIIFCFLTDGDLLSQKEPVSFLLSESHILRMAVCIAMRLAVAVFPQLFQVKPGNIDSFFPVSFQNTHIPGFFHPRKISHSIKDG